MWWTAIILGLAGSFHCAGMCGPLIMAMPAKGSRVQFALKKVVYSLGRITTYGLLGVGVGVLGEGLDLVGFQRYASLISGVLLLIAYFVGIKKKSSGTVFNFIKKGLGKAIQQNGLSSHYIFGFLNGFLPCGLTVFALIAALSQLSLMNTVLYMVLFGLGTFPMMIVIPLFGGTLLNKVKNKLNYRSVVLVVSLLLIVRGMNLGIPYLSPSIQNIDAEVELVKGECG